MNETSSAGFGSRRAEAPPVFTIERTEPTAFASMKPMSDPRNDAHDKKVSQEKKHQGKDEPAESPAAAAPSDLATLVPNAVLEASLAVLAKCKDLEFHSRANLERLAELTLTVEDELKQKALVAPLSEVYSAQSAVQTKLTALIEAYKAECDRIQG
jgi:hypothetical protein